MGGEQAGSPERPKCRITPEGLIRATDFVRKRFELVGIAIPSGCRLELAERLVKSVIDRPQLVETGDSEFLRRLAGAHWTILEFHLIARAGHVPLTWRNQLQGCLGGAELEEHDKNRQPRNLLFEVYVAALLSASQLPVLPLEPDLHVWLAGKWIGIAAKRVASSRQIRRRGKEAAKQIERSGTPGFVTINLDQVLIHRGVAGFADRVADRRAEAVKGLREFDRSLRQSALVLGRIAFGRDFVWDFSGEKPSLALERYLQVQPTSDSHLALAAIEDLSHGWQVYALPRLQNL